ncbi:MAG: hypothetical protein HZT40_07280 [Candidatus Thiothrix singaporensis]|uniref:VOC domain-containing protein n=1 Tax=Candidatus Thiothrix singaporensis TaxID=2799669 RepID=A0A7L6AQR9_9GAMM|nr:MAG: hypothetical protein HZT40_07280 [Candidatus Thiothrix singaporensis]
MAGRRNRSAGRQADRHSPAPARIWHDRLTLELFEYVEQPARPEPPAANRPGYGHMAFEVSDVEAVRSRILECGGQDLGVPVVHPLPGHGTITFTYMTDPEGNILELQSWDGVSRYGALDS